MQEEASDPKSKAIRRLSRALNRIPELKQLKRFSPEFEKWKRDTQIAITNTFEDNPDYVEDFKSIMYSPSFSFSGMPDSHYQGGYVRGLDSAASKLESMIDEIKEYWEGGEQSAATQNTEFSGIEISNEVFVVHGKDDGAKETVARLLDTLDLQPVILHEQPNQGRTIIEKFEQYAQVGFAVVLLTPDDICSPPDQSGSSRPRARQNVILELGFFLGRLGRNRTFALKKGDLELPSDYDGVLYIPMDDKGAWRVDLVRELKGAGLDVDANLIL